MGIFKRKKQIVDRNGVSTSRWFNEEPVASMPVRRIPRPAPSDEFRRSSGYRFSDAEREGRDIKIAEFREETESKPASEEAKRLWLALYVKQGGRVRKGNYSDLARTEMPTVDAPVDFPVGYGSAAVHAVVIEGLTPSINTDGISGDRRGGWEHGHGKSYVIRSQDGRLYAETNEAYDVSVTASEYYAASSMKRDEIVELANGLSTTHGIAATATAVMGTQVRDLVQDVEKPEVSVYTPSSRSERATRGIPSAPSRRSLAHEEDESSIDRVVRDPLGISDPFGVKDPVAAMIRSSTGLSSFDPFG